MSSPLAEPTAETTEIAFADATFADATFADATFADLGLSGPMLETIAAGGYATPTPIQARTIPLLLAGRDVVGQAQTGTGKTAAFAVPLLERLDAEQKSPQVLVLTPTRELAIQVAEAFERYAKGTRSVRVAAVYGGQDYQVQFRQLDRGVQIIVGTPGRVMDHVRRGSLSLEGLRAVVLDEADEMLRMGFADDVEWVLAQCPAERQIALFSATMPAPIRRIAQQYLRDPAHVTIEQKCTTADTIHQRCLVVAPHQKDQALARILEAEPIDGVLIFVKAKVTTEPLAEYLSAQGHRAAALSSDVPQKQRERIIDNLRSGKLDVIVATDVAARGLDVQRISHVINYDLPFDNESYVHRIGRTGRAGRSGNAILFLHPREKFRLRRLEQATRQKIEMMDIPSKRVINQRRVARFHERITAALGHAAIDTFASVIEQYRGEHDVPWEKVAAALAVIAAGDTPLLLKEDLKPQAFHDQQRESFRDSGPRRDFQRSGGDERRGEFNRNDERPRGGARRGGEMETFRIEVGHAHQVKPGNIVGAIANELGTDSSVIGRIEIFDQFSTVDMLVGMPQDMFRALQRVRVAGRPLEISRLGDGPRTGAPRTDAPRGDRPQEKAFEAQGKFVGKKKKAKAAVMA